MATPVALKSGLVVAIFSIDKIMFDSKKVTSIATDLISRSIFSGAILRISEIDSNETVAFWSGHYDDTIKNIEGNFCLQIDLIVEKETTKPIRRCCINIENLVSIKSHLNELVNSLPC